MSYKLNSKHVFFKNQKTHQLSPEIGEHVEVLEEHKMQLCHRHAEPSSVRPRKMKEMNVGLFDMMVL